MYMYNIQTKYKMSKQIQQPELILRDHLQSKKQIEKKGDSLVFENSQLIKLNTPTPFMQSQEKYYTIGSIWKFLLLIEMPLHTYINECRKDKIEHIANKDKQALKNFFLLGKDDVEIYDKDYYSKVGLLGKKHELKEENKEESEEKERKKEKKEDKEYKYSDPSLIVINYLRLKENSQSNRNSILRCSNYKFDGILSLCRRNFMKISGNVEENKNVKDSFFEELTSSQSKSYKCFYVLLYIILSINIFLLS